MNQKTFLNVLKVGIYLTFLSHFFVFKNLLFPYITSKQIYFNIVVELLTIVWLFFIIKYPEWRPKKSWLTYGIFAFFGVVLASCFTGVDFNLSFWGDVERMLGWFHLFHFLLFYLIIITVFRTWEDWKSLFLVSVITAVLVSIYGIGQQFEIVSSPYGASRIISTIGNAAYVGAYAIFNIYFVFILFAEERNWGTRSIYIVSSILIFLALFFSGTRGSYFGIVIGVFVFLIMIAFLNKNKNIKKYSSIILGVFIIFLVAMFVFKESPVFKNNAYIYRLTHTALNDPTVNTRLLSWKAAWLDFHNHPLLGTGYGNYAITFDKYFEPQFFNYTRGETYFDRAHNNIVDIASTTGILGITTYLAIFVFAFYYLIRAYRKGTADLSDIALVTSLIVAYFIQNMLVFDAMVTYIALMMVLGYIYWLAREDKDIKYVQEKELGTGKFYTIGIITVVMAIVIYQGNIKPTLMLIKTIEAQNFYSSSRGDILGTVNIYKEALSYNSVLDRDSRTTLHRLIGSANPSGYANYKKEEVDAIITFSIDTAEKNVAYNPNDSLNLLMLSQIYMMASAVYQSDNIKSFEYIQKAEDAVNRSIAASPGRIPTYYYKAQIQLTKNEKDKAIETLIYARDLNPLYSDSHCQLAQIYLYYKDEKKGMPEMDLCLDQGGQGQIRSADNIIGLLQKYEKRQDWKKMLSLGQRLTEIDPNNAQYWINLAKLYAKNNMFPEAKKAAAKVGELDPKNKDAADAFIKQLDDSEQAAQMN